jgi:cytoskeletal protein CcmA (bactofilin family)
MEIPQESRAGQRDTMETEAQAVPSQAANGNLASRTSSPAESTPTYISPGIKIKGTITADEDLYIDGDVKGSLSVPRHCVTVGERAYVRAETLAREIVIYGAVQGGLSAFDRIEIKRHASVAGDLATGQIFIEDGACFKGVISADGKA